jgi:hypothetical protein
MPRNLTPEDRWETDFQVPIPGEPRSIGPLEVLFQRLLNRTERLRSRIADILGLPWDATPPDTITGLAGRVDTLESNAYLNRGSVTSAVDWNTLTNAGTYEIASGAFGTGSANTPPAVTQQGHLLVFQTSGATTQVYVPKGDDPGIYWRQYAGGTWSPWTTAGAMYGSNSNGSYLRFADGTQICWAEQPTGQWGASTQVSASVGGITVYAKDIVGVTFPAAFIAEPAIVVGGDVGGLQLKSFTAWNSSASSFNITATYQHSGASIFSYYIAIGRWR